MTHQGTVALETERLLLRRFTLDDADAMYRNFQVDDLPATVDEAIRFGATKAAEQYGDGHYVTMLDPEGHPFCLCRKLANIENAG